MFLPISSKKNPYKTPILRKLYTAQSLPSLCIYLYFYWYSVYSAQVNRVLLRGRLQVQILSGSPFAFYSCRLLPKPNFAACNLAFNGVCFGP